MPNLTIRNIPAHIMNKIRALSEIEKRSINSEILLMLEKGLHEEHIQQLKRTLSRDTRAKLWKNMSGKWSDTRTTEEIIKEIYDERSEGRTYTL